VAEEAEGPDSGLGESGVGVDPAGVELALAGASRADAGAYLKAQRGLIEEQRHHLKEQFKLLRLGVWEKRLGILLRIATAAMGLAIAAGLGLMVWSASQSKDLLVEPFSVPPDLAARGQTGEAISAALLDELSSISRQSVGQRPAASYANNWEQQNLKVEVPETGVSLSELDRFLRARLGNDTHISGEIVRAGPDIRLTVRAGTFGAASVAGPESELDSLVHQLGEAVFRLTQTYRYGFYLSIHGRVEEAVAVYKAMAKTGPAWDRSWGYGGWSNVVADSAPLATRTSLMMQALELNQDNPLFVGTISLIDAAKSQPERIVRDTARASALLSGDGRQTVRADLLPVTRNRYQAAIAMAEDDFGKAGMLYSQVVRAGGTSAISIVSAPLAEAQTGAHDLRAARATLADPDTGNGVAPGNAMLSNLRAGMAVAVAGEDWAGVLTQAKAIDPLTAKYPGLPSYLPTMTEPLIALARAHLGDIAGAEAAIAATPADCYLCLRMRATIAEVNGDRNGADAWFARAVQSNPSIALAESEWGAALLARGDTAGAIAKFKLANQKGPHFADPLEGWGEALMVQNRSDLAAAKFSQADAFAPHWGRLHLKWGEALTYAGKKEEAKKQFALAATLDLTAAERKELAGTPHG
jgi:Tfp pilus assembly protein PilF